MLLKVPRKFLIFHWLQICQGSMQTALSSELVTSLNSTTNKFGWLQAPVIEIDSRFREGSVVGLPSAPRNLTRSQRRLSRSERKENTSLEFQHRGKRGAFKGPIRIPLHSLLFLFNALAFPGIPSNSLKFRPEVFSIPTAPANQLS